MKKEDESVLSEHSMRVSKLAEYVQTNLIGFQNLRNKSYSSATQNYLDCKRLADELEDNIKKCESLINIGVCKYFNGKFKAAKEDITEAVEISFTLLNDEKHEFNKVDVKLFLFK